MGIIKFLGIDLFFSENLNTNSVILDLKISD
jgi:hypothetical protein